MPDGLPVTPGSTSLGDYLVGLDGAVGVLIAVLHVRAGGSGQVVDIGLYEAVFRVLDELAPAYPQRHHSRAGRSGHAQRLFAQSLPDPRRQVDRHRLHNRQDVRQADEGHRAY
jgi:crotonobetainyl-CoA:carnitine CoA-transferase CaiB-like acyl-CoA transferase